jgi:hypothetical protein
MLKLQELKEKIDKLLKCNKCKNSNILCEKCFFRSIKINGSRFNSKYITNLISKILCQVK